MFQYNVENVLLKSEDLLFFVMLAGIHCPENVLHTVVLEFEICDKPNE